MATPVQCRIVGLAIFRRPQREEQHAPFCAKRLLVASGMPPLPEALGRKHDKRASGLEYRVAACLLARAHEGADASAARADALRLRDGLPPFAAALGPLAGAAERLDHRQFEKRRIAVGEPFPSGERQLFYAAEIPGVLVAQPCAARILTDVARKGRKLAVFLYYPVVPIALS